MPNASVALVKIPGWLKVLKIWIGMMWPCKDPPHPRAAATARFVGKQPVLFL
jgi:hypothetical protein